LNTTTVILGGGFGGIHAANTLRRLVPAEHEIIVVDKDDRFYLGAGKTWVMLGERSLDNISRPIRELLEPGVQFVQAAVESIDVNGKRVTANDRTWSWDHLVIGLGADFDWNVLPGLTVDSHHFYTPAAARRLQDELAKFVSGKLIILVARTPFKCPPAPYEAAMLLAHHFKSRGLGDRVQIAVYTVEGAPMATAGPEMGQFILGQLAERQIAFHPGKQATRIDGAGRRIAFADGTDTDCDFLIVIPPHGAPKVVRDAGLTGASGWIPVDPQTLAVKESATGVYAIGDVTSVSLPGRFSPDMPLVLPKAGVFAEAHGRVAAHQIAAKILGQKPEEIFDGQGYCYLEVGGGQAVKGEGSFFAMPHPMMTKRNPDQSQFQDKLDWASALLKPLR
jgi:sulfide:quinone oxidoreductase